MKALAYIRVSQEDEKPENQIEAIKRWTREHGVEVLGYYIDIDVSEMGGASFTVIIPKYRDK